MTTNDQRENILNKIKALRAKTVTNGCTEAEAMAAMQKMHEMMERYQVDEASIEDVQAAKYGIGKKTMGKQASRRFIWHPAAACRSRLAELAHVKCYRDLNDNTIKAFGEEQDLLAFWYYLDLVQTSSDASWAAYRKDNKGASMASFYHGFVARIAECVVEIVAARKKVAASLNQEQGLMVQTKDAILTSRWDSYQAQTGLKLRNARSRGTVRDGIAYGAGKAAGSRVSFGGGVAGVGSGRRQIG